MNMYCRIVATVALVTASMTGVAAQDRPASPTLPMMQGGGMPGMSMMAMGTMGRGMMGAAMMMAEHIEGRIAFLKTELKITDTQLPQWNAFANSLRSSAKRMTEMRETMPSKTGQATSMTAPERFDRIEKMMTTMLGIVRSTKETAVPLYAVLNNEQKKMADGFLRGPMGINLGRRAAQ